MTHRKSHGWQAAQAKRRGESWIQCTDCTHPRPFRHDEPEERPTFWRMLGLVVFVLAMYAVVLYALPVVLVGLAGHV